jgi:GAF domain
LTTYNERHRNGTLRAEAIALKAGNSNTVKLTRSPFQALLDASQTNTAILDETAKIIAANRAWLESNDTSGFSGTSPGLGEDYLRICDLSNPGSNARLAAKGIRAVLAGRQNQFEFEYWGRGPEQDRRWRITVTRCEDLGKVLAVVAHFALNEVTEAGGSDFEDLLADFSSAFVRTTADQTDSEIEEWLQRIGLALGVDRASVTQLSPDHRNLYVTHQWAREGVSPIPIGMDVKEVLPWVASKFMAGELVVVSRQEELPPEASSDLNWARSSRRKSNVSIPLRVGGSIVGGVAFGSVFQERTWSPRTVKRLQLVADVFGNALERKRTVMESSSGTGNAPSIAGGDDGRADGIAGA